MIILERVSDNKLTMRDVRSKKKMTFFYRDPTTDEVVKFNNNTMLRMRKVLVYNPSGARLQGGYDVLTGIGEGEMGIRVGDEIKAISSDPKSENYDENWKDLVREYRSQELMLLGAHVFESTVIVQENDAIPGEGKETLIVAGDEEEDLEGNSSETSQR